MKHANFAVVAGAALIAGASASAGIVSWSGQLEMVPEGPVSFAFGAMANDNNMSLYIETTGHVLENQLMADVPGQDGNYHRFNRPAQPFGIPAGTVIDSYYIHQDIVGSDPNKMAMMTFTITFSQPILGLIVGGDWDDASLFRTTLDDSDFLAGPNVDHTRNADGRRRGALEGNAAAEFLTISNDGYTLTGSLHTRAHHVDNVRVITQGSIIPTPGGAALLGLAGLLTIRRRRA